MICEITGLGEGVLNELRQANPVDAEALPSSRSPKPAAKLEEILDRLGLTPEAGKIRTD